MDLNGIWLVGFIWFKMAASVWAPVGRTPGIFLCPGFKEKQHWKRKESQISFNTKNLNYF
jgi:hypothetical protein